MIKLHQNHIYEKGQSFKAELSTDYLSKLESIND